MTGTGPKKFLGLRPIPVGLCILLALLLSALAGASASQAAESGDAAGPQCMVEPWYCGEEGGEEEGPQCMVEPWYCETTPPPQCMVEPWYCSPPPNPCTDSSCSPVPPVSDPPPAESSPPPASALTQSPVSEEASESGARCGQGKVRRHGSCGRKCRPANGASGKQKRVARQRCGRRRG